MINFFCSHLFTPTNHTHNQGRPVYIQHLGSIDMKRLLEFTTEDRMIKFHVQEYERLTRYILPACSKVAGRHIDATFTILDLKGVGIRHLTGDVKRMMGKIVAIDGDNFPEMMGHMCIINAPPVFKAFWGAIRPMLDARTQSKIEVCSTKYTPALLEWIDASSLPEYLGGTSKGTLLDDVGPWQDPRIIAEIDADAGRVAGAAGIAEEEGEVPPEPVAVAAAAPPPPPSAPLPLPLPRRVRVAAEPPARAVPPMGVSSSSMPAAAADDEFADARSESSYASARSAGSAALAPGPTPRAEAAAKAESLLARVAALEAALPAAAGGAPRAAAAAVQNVTGRGTLVMRVEALEAAVDVLVRAAEERARAQPGCACVVQ